MDALGSVATVLSAFGADSRQGTTARSQGPIARLPTAVTIVTTPAAFTIAPPFIKATPSISWCDARPECRIAPLWRTGGARDLSKTASDERACLCYCCRRSRAGQPCDRQIAISRLCERRSGGWRNEGLGCPRVLSAPEEDRCQRSGLSRARGVVCDGSGRGGGVA